MKKINLKLQAAEIKRVKSILTSTRFALLFFLAVIISAIYPNNSPKYFDLLAIVGSLIFLVFNWLSNRSRFETENLSK